jgi:hypothetical protein
MSLSLSVVQPNGATAGFWILNSVNLNTATKLVTIQMDGYISSDIYNAGGTPLTSTTISSVFDPTHVLPGVSVLYALYCKIELDPFFAGATYTDDGI